MVYEIRKNADGTTAKVTHLPDEHGPHEIEPIEMWHAGWHGVEPPVADDFPVDAELEPASMGLMVRLMQHNAAETAAMTNRVIEDKADEIRRLTATLAFIRGQITYLCNQKYAPNPMRILDALYPDDDQVAMYEETGQ